MQDLNTSAEAQSSSSVVKTRRVHAFEFVPQKDLLRQKLEALYNGEQKSICQIAKDLQTFPNAICAFMQAFGIETRKTALSRTKRILNKVSCVPSADILEQELKELYENQRLSTIQIAKKWNVHSNVILCYLWAFGIPTNPKGRVSVIKKALRSNEIEGLKSELERMYLVEGLTTLEIAKKVNLTGQTVSRCLRSLGISDRFEGRRFSQKLKVTMPSKKDTANELKRLYIDDGLSIIQIAEIWHVNVATVFKNMKKHGIELRSRERFSVITRRLQLKGLIQEDTVDIEPIIKELFLKLDSSYKSLADYLGVSAATIQTYLNTVGLLERGLVCGRKRKLDPLLSDPEKKQMLEQRLRALYSNNQVTLVEISKELGIPAPSVQECLALFNIPKRNKNVDRKSNSQDVREL